MKAKVSYKIKVFFIHAQHHGNAARLSLSKKRLVIRQQPQVANTNVTKKATGNIKTFLFVN